MKRKKIIYRFLLLAIGFSFIKTKCMEGNLQLSSDEKMKISFILNNKSEEIDLVRTNTDTKQPVCETCHKVFSTLASLRRHERNVHKGEKRFSCEYEGCGKNYSELSYLKEHTMREHTGERPYKCFFCEKGFSNFTDLKTHERIHTGDRPYKCAICSKKFRTSSNLKVHERRHTGERPYKCTTCGKGFITSTDLRNHNITHT